ncbi:MAG: type I methionyl aminopeptidase [Candidatus Mycalebacterium zealandia]|nr:MAG: type I methionyl aminopeptidase [Candidatus Mycalebacterium zealandia]
MTAGEIKRKFNGMKVAASVVSEVLEKLSETVREGVSTWELNRIAEEIAEKRSARPAFKGYMDFPCSICASVNDEVVHGIPSKDRILKDGDIVGIDFGAFVDGFYGDSAITVPIGTTTPRTEKLLQAAKESLDRGIEKAFPSKRLYYISETIQQHAENKGFSVVKAFVGHGIGENLHEEPQVPNFLPPGGAGAGPILRPGMALAIEPMVNEGEADIKTLSDNWTVVTSDGKMSAHFEHTVAITENGPEVLTSFN